MNLELLKAKIDQSDISKSELAEALGISRQGLYNKLDGEKEFKGSEIKTISRTLKLTSAERDAIFFADFVGECANRMIQQ